MKTPFNLSAALAMGRAVCRDGSVATGLCMDGGDLVGIVNCRDKRWTCDGTWYGAIGHRHGHPLDLVGVPDPSDNPRDSLARGTDPFGGTVIGAGWPQDKKRTLVAVPEPEARTEAGMPLAHSNETHPSRKERTHFTCVWCGKVFPVADKCRAGDACENCKKDFCGDQYIPSDELTRLRAEMARLEQVAIDQRDCIGRLRAENAELKAERFQAFSDLHARVRELEEALTSVMETVSDCTDDGRWSDDCCAAMDKARALLEGGKV